MKIIVVGDIHLKPETFNLLSKKLKETEADAVLFTGDLPDDYGQGQNIELYEKTFLEAKKFVENNNDIDVYFVIGNHELSYLYSDYPNNATSRKYSKRINELIIDLYNNTNHAIAYKFDKTIISHAGITLRLLKDNYLQNLDVDEAIEKINSFPVEILMDKESPVWYRILYNLNKPLAYEDKYIQVIGHTQMDSISECRSSIMVDVLTHDHKEVILLDTDNPYNYKKIIL